MNVGLVDLKWGGHHTPYVVYLSRYFTDHGHRVTFVTRKENPRLDELPDSDDLTIRAVDFPTFPDDSPQGLFASVREQLIRVAQLREIYRTVHDADVDVVHLLYFDRTQVPFWIAAKSASMEMPPTVATLHRDAFLDNSDRTVLTLATQTMTRLALDSTLANGSLDCLTVHANSIRDRIIGAVPAATRANTRTIPAPTPDLTVEVSQSEARDYLDLPQNHPVFLFFGGLRYEKGPDVLAEALRDVDREITVVFAGSEADFTQADVDAWKGDTPGHVHIEDRIEFVPEVDVDYYFVAADALVLPYRRERGISGPLRRAAWVSTPIIGNRGSDIGDLIETHELGYTFGDRTRLAELLSSVGSESSTELGSSLSDFARSRHWSRTGESMIDIYEECTDAV